LPSGIIACGKYSYGKDEQAKQEPAVNPADVQGVPGTSATSDAVLARMQKETPAALEGAIESIAKGANPAMIFEDAGRQLEDENFAANAAALHGEFISSGQQVLRNVGVPETHFEAFENWVRKSDPDLA